MTSVKGIFINILKYPLLAVLICIIFLSLVSLISIITLSIILQNSLLKEISLSMTTPVSLLSSLIALLIPFVLITVERERNLEHKKEIKVKVFNAVIKIKDFCISNIDQKKDNYKDIIDNEMSLGLAGPIEIMNRYKDEALEIGIVFSIIKEKRNGLDNYIYIIIDNKLEIQMISPSYGRIIHAIIKYKDRIITNEEKINIFIQSLRKKIQK
jgi:hypothetical protein